LQNKRKAQRATRNAQRETRWNNAAAHSTQARVFTPLSTSANREGNKKGRKGGNAGRRAHLLEVADKRVRRKKKGEWVERCAPRRCRAAVSTTATLIHMAERVPHRKEKKGKSVTKEPGA
jgi:hypothetical protein